MKPIDLYRTILWRSWSEQQKPRLTDIPVAKAQLLGRAGEFEPRTAAWLSSLRDPTWCAVRCARTGHTIHCVSDRSRESLMTDLTLGLRIMSWMSHRALTWYWWDHDWPRVLPAYTEPSREHVNGGWAVPGILEVHVYRREEAHKVLIHEIVHALGLDVPLAAIPPVLATFERDLGRRLWPHLGESMTELLAEWLWCIASASSLREAISAWSSQLRCSKKQAVIVWTRIYNSTDDEKTNIFAYYILKWVLMQHLEVALLSPTTSVSHWFEWWRSARPTIEIAIATEAREQSMGMTCPAAKIDY